MNFLNKEKKEAKWLTIVLGIFVAISYMFANLSRADMTVKAMSLLMGIEVNGGYYALTVIMGGALSYLLFILFVTMNYSIAYRTLVNKTRDIKVMPVPKESFINHMQFLSIFANIIIGFVDIALRFSPIIEPVVGMIVRILIKVATYMIVLLLLSRVGVGDNVKKKLFGGFLTPLAVMAALLV